ncbi:hypothetical protein RJT34_23509 [Clitoria ternatea]|uniref:Uncharacterized protein n=1 Tax=Clitoria ternatea TaxID=43366 RepID=A0AAN9FMR5_CLITE
MEERAKSVPAPTFDGFVEFDEDALIPFPTKRSSKTKSFGQQNMKKKGGPWFQDHNNQVMIGPADLQYNLYILQRQKVFRG